MATEFKLPDLGENIEEAEVLKVLVSEGDVIEADQPVLEVETDKAVFELPCDVAGRIATVQVAAGDTIAVGQVVLTLEPVAPSEERAESQEPPAREPAAEPEAEPPPPAGERPPGARTEAASPRPAPAPSDADRPPVFASPAVRKFAREISVDIHAVPGSGPGGRISIDDVKEYARGARAAPPAVPSGPSAAPELPDFSSYGGTDREHIGGVQRATARGMSLSWSTIPHVTLFAKADVSALEEFRQRHRAQAEAAGGQLTLLPILLKLVADGLKTHPRLNASVDVEGRENILKRYYHVGVAVDTERGLLVPVLRDVDRKSIIELSVEVTELAERARAGRLTLEEMRGASFTVSNLGAFGTGFFTPIISHPEVAVLGVGRAEMEPLWSDGEFEPRLRLPLSLSHDHRIVDGAEGARFLRWIVQATQDPPPVASAG